MSTQIKIRRDTAANWTTANPILGQGEPALETDTQKEKIGDGTTVWTSLAYKATGTGDMLAATYDPGTVAGDAFDMDNMTEPTTAKTTPVDADTMPLNDSAAAAVFKKVTWANIKATLKTYFDGFYGSGAGDMLLAGVQTVTGAKTFEDATILLRNVADTFSSKFTNTNTAARTYTLPDKDMTVAGTDDVDKRAQVLIVAFSDETTAIDAGTGKVTFTMPNYATTLTGVAVSFVTAPTTSAITLDLNEGGTSVLSTKITVDATEKTSETAATPPVISDSSIAANAILSLDVDTADTGGTSAGGKLLIYFNKA